MIFLDRIIHEGMLCRPEFFYPVSEVSHLLGFGGDTFGALVVTCISEKKFG